MYLIISLGNFARCFFMELKMKKSNHIFVYCLSFFIPMLIVMIAYGTLGIYFGGNNTLLIFDLKEQLLPIYAYLNKFGPGFDSLFYSMSGATGNFYGTVAYYYSLFDIAYCFVDLKHLPDAIYCVTLIKISYVVCSCLCF